MVDLNTRIAPSSGWVLQKATAINNRGQIAGVGTRIGQPRIFLLSPGPLPNLGWSWSNPRHTHAHLTWNSIPGFGYAVERSTDLTIWTSRARLTGTADSSALDLPAHPGVEAEFWRVLFTPFPP